MGQLSIDGNDDLAIELEKIIPSDLKNIKLNQSKYYFLTNEKGGIYDDLIVTKVEKGFSIILNAACKNNDFTIIKKALKDKFKLTLHNDLSLIALQGPESPKILEKLIKGVSILKFMNGKKFHYNNNFIYITRSGYTGEDGFEISLPNDLAEDFVKKLIDTAGGISVVAHPYRRIYLEDDDVGSDAYDVMLERASTNPMILYTDAVEVLNSRGTQRENAFANDVAEKFGKPSTGASDAHRPEDLGKFATEFHCPINGLEDFISEFKSKRFHKITLNGV